MINTILLFKDEFEFTEFQIKNKDRNTNGVTQKFLDEHDITLQEYIDNNPTLEGCFNCWQCKLCKKCKNCIDCDNCIDCNNCDNCIKCYKCKYVTDSQSSLFCEHLGESKDCYQCYICNNCDNCKLCNQCYDSRNLIDCENNERKKFKIL